MEPLRRIALALALLAVPLAARAAEPLVGSAAVLTTGLAGPEGLAFTREAKLVRTGLEPLLARWGVKLGDNVIVDLKGLVRYEPNPFTWGTRDGYGDHAVARKMRGRLVSFPFSRSVTPEEKKAPNGQKITARTLVAVGELDKPDFQAIAKRLASEIEGAQSATIAGAGHLASMERPEETARLMREFLQR